jgi:sulfopyruvate decarboxylase subunit beta
MMNSLEALNVILEHRGNAIVVSTMTCGAEWSHISKYPELDLPVTGAMSKASSIGLGLALARPDKKVIVLDGDGSLLMNLGSLVTIANMAPVNLIHFLFRNGVYRLTGGQPTPGATKANFASIARGAGYANVHDLEDLQDLKNNIETILKSTGPTFACVRVPPATERSPFPMVTTRSAMPRLVTALGSL